MIQKVQKVLRQCDPNAGAGMREVQSVQQCNMRAKPIPHPPTEAKEVESQCDSFVFEFFTAEDAWELEHFLCARSPQQAAGICYSTRRRKREAVLKWSFSS
ncbi:hypothetical protein GQ53DRAFT_761121 [Thozetella sp. PMI_491]|nr:hypothetical protein GQ53DRAFT_761121 [Thozetella sp. PMI_491]